MENTLYVITDENGDYIHFTNSYSECLAWMQLDPLYSIAEWDEDQHCYIDIRETVIEC